MESLLLQKRSPAERTRITNCLALEGMAQKPARDFWVRHGPMLNSLRQHRLVSSCSSSRCDSLAASFRSSECGCTHLPCRHSGASPRFWWPPTGPFKPRSLLAHFRPPSSPCPVESVLRAVVDSGPIKGGVFYHSIHIHCPTIGIVQCFESDSVVVRLPKLLDSS